MVHSLFRLLARVLAMSLVAGSLTALPAGVGPAVAQVVDAEGWVPVDFREWDLEGEPSNWSFSAEGRRLTNSSNQNGLAYAVFPGEVDAVEVRGTISVQTSVDDDMIGGTFGLTKPVAVNGDPVWSASSVTWLWKQASSGAPEGLTLSRFVDAPLIPGDIAPKYWESGEGVDLLDSDLNLGTGWQNFVRYDYRGLYTPDRVEIWIDDSLVLSADGVFPAGRFGVASISQQGATFEDFEYRLLDLSLAVDAGADQTVSEGDVVTLAGTGGLGLDTASRLVDTSDFSEMSNFTVLGRAAAISNPRLSALNEPFIRLVDHAHPTVAGLYAQDRVRLDTGSVVQSRFSFEVSDPQMGGADGIALVLSPEPVLGRSGGYIGLDTPNIVAIELDTYLNAWDETENHVGVVVNGDVGASVEVPVDEDFENGERWTAWIEYDTGRQMLSTWVGVGDVRPAEPVLVESIDLQSVLGTDKPFIGIHGSNGGAAWETIDLYEWTVDVVQSSSAVPEWTVVSADGPPVQLLGADTFSPTFQGLDDGDYTFRLTASMGDQVAADEVTVTVRNADPVIGVESQPTSEDGLIMVTTSFTDAGIADDHTATIDWGDGTSSVDVAGVPGTGWGAISAAHVYDSPGSYTVAVTVVDDDGGTVGSSVGIVIEDGGVPQPVPGVAIWGDDPEAKEAVKISGGRHQVMGLLHSNSAYVNSSNDSVFIGGTEFVDGGGSKPKPESNVYDPAPVVVDVRDRPVAFEVVDYQPGGRAAVAAGDQFFDLSELCGPNQDQTWKPDAALQVGLYWVPCKKVEFQNEVTTLGPVTIVTTGEIKSPAGERFFGAPYVDDLLLLTTREGQAIDIGNGGSVFGGFVVAQNGKIKVTGGGHSFQCGVLGESIEITGGDHVFDATQCGSIDDSGGLSDGVEVAAPPVVVPSLSLSAAAPESVLGGQGYEVTATVGNDGVELVVPGLVAVANGGLGAYELTSAVFELERFDVATQEWVTVASSDDGGVTLTQQALARTAIYPPEGGIAGTTVPVGSDGVWSVLAASSLDPATVAVLTDANQTDAVRARLTIGTSGSGIGLRQTTRFGGDIRTALDGVATGISGAVSIVSSGDGQPDPSTPTDLALGALTTNSFPLQASSVAARAEFEPEATYLARLQDADGRTQAAVSQATGTAAIGPVYAPAVVTQTALAIPVVRASAPEQLAAIEVGAPVEWTLTLSNTGSTAAQVEVTGSAFDSPVQVSPDPVTIEPGGTAEVVLSTTVPADADGTFFIDAEIAWTDSAGNSFGPITRTTRGRIQIDTVLDVRKTAVLPFDDPGNGLDYAVSITNTGNDPITGIVLTDQIDTNLTVEAGTATTSQGSVAVDADNLLTADIGTIEPGDTIILSYVVDPTSLPANQVRVENQATVTSNELPPVFSDDPAVPGAADPTVFVFDTPPGNAGRGVTIIGIGDPTGPNATAITPAAGTEVTVPTDITVGFELTEGRTLTDYTVSLYPAGGDPEAGTVIAEGTTDPAGGVVGTIDPTILSNGVQIIRIVATDDTGATRLTESPVVIDGNLKLGRFALSYEDMNMNVGGLPVSLIRSYDTLDRAQSDDFGFGWDLQVANVTAQRSIDPLGFGPWDGVSCGGGFLFTDICYTAENDNRFVTVTWPNGETESFDLTAKGNTFFPILVTFAYEPRGNATSTLKPVGADATGGFANGSMTRGGFGGGGIYNPAVFELTDRFGTVYLVDIDDGVQEMTDRNGNTVTVTDDGIVSSQGPSISFDRDGQGRITTATGPDGETVTYGYDAAGDLTVVTDQNGAGYGFDYDASHYLTGIDDPGPGPRQVLTYSADGRLESVTDAKGNTTQISVDPDTRTEIVIGPDPRLTVVRSFDERGNVLVQEEVFGGESLRSEFVYNDRDQVVLHADPTGAVSVAEFDDEGNWVSHTDPDGVVTSTVYDEFGNVVSVSVDGSVLGEYGYDPAGNLVSVFADGVTQTMTYDGNGRLVSASNGTTVQTYSYDANGFLASTTGPEDTTGYVNDPSGRVLSVTDPTGATTTYTYDAVGNQLSTTDANGDVRSFVYDERDQLVSDTIEGDLTRSYVYDSVGQLVSYTDRNGVETVFEYNRYGLLTTATAPDTTTLIGYDPLGRPVSAVNETGSIDIGWDGRDQIVSESFGPGSSVSFPVVEVARSWSPGGRASSLSDPVGSTSYSYDARGRLATVNDSIAGGFGFGYDGFDRLASLTRPNSIDDTYDYTGDLLTSWEASGPQGVVAFQDRVFDSRRLLTEFVDGDGVHSVSIDDAGQIVAVDHPTAGPVADEEFVYDPAGNMSEWAGNPAAEVEYVAGRLVSDAANDYFYDAEGRVTQIVSADTGAATTIGWNSRGRIVSITSPDGTFEYGYDPFGRQVTRTVDGVTEFVVFDQLNPRLVLNQTGAVSERLVHTPELGGLLAVESAAGVAYPINDPDGSQVASTGPAGSVIAEYSYDTFGQLVNSPEPVGAGWHGLTPDDSGLYFTFARAYDPTVGRFLSQDPLQAANEYEYALNNPLQYSDPTGFIALTEYGVQSSDDNAQAGSLCQGGSVIGAIVLDVAVDLALGSLGGGLYSFTVDDGKTYVGRSKDIARRLQEHGRAGKIKGSVRYLPLENFDRIPKDQIRRIEQAAINDCSQGVGLSKDLLANKRNELGEAARKGLGPLKQYL